MNRNFDTSFPKTTKRTRIAAALVAVLCTVLIGSGIDGLADYVQGQSAVQMAAKTQPVVAQR